MNLINYGFVTDCNYSIQNICNNLGKCLWYKSSCALKENMYIKKVIKRVLKRIRKSNRKKISYQTNQIYLSWHTNFKWKFRNKRNVYYITYMVFTVKYKNYCYYNNYRAAAIEDGG